MEYSYINLLEAMKSGEYSDYHDYLSDIEIRELLNWYDEFTNTMNTSVEEIIRLFYFLYMHEYLDMYPIPEYHQTVDNLAREFHFDRDKFLDLLKGYSSLVFGY